MANIKQVAEVRKFETDVEDLTEARAARFNKIQAWRSRVGKIDALARGDWAEVFPDETVENLGPMVMNIVQVGLDDISSLVSESAPSTKVWPKSDKKADQDEAFLLGAIAETYWELNKGPGLNPILAMDLAATGACFVVAVPDEEGFPCYRRIDPRTAYPDTFGNQIYDLFVAQTMRLRDAARVFPKFAEQLNVGPEVADGCEVWEYYAPGTCAQAISLIKGGSPVKGGVYIVKEWKHDLPVPPVAMARVPSNDGEFRGLYDQIAGSLLAKNRILQLTLDYADQLTYAPLVSKGLLNEDEQPGPTARYRLDPNVQDAQVGRLSPAGASPQLFSLLGYLDQEQRGGVANPQTRQGQVSQSIASASFVNATQGQLTSVVRKLQRLIADLRDQLNDISFVLDRKSEVTRPLVRNIGKKGSYKPSRDIPDRKITSRVVYGAGSGISALESDTRVLQLFGAGLLSKETSRTQIDFLAHDAEEQDRIEKELADGALAQKFLESAPVDQVAAVVNMMDAEGIGLPDAIAIFMKMQAEAAPPAAPPMADPGAGLPPGAPMQAGAPDGSQSGPMETQMALEKGGTSAVGEQEPMAPPVGLDQLMVRQ